MDLGAGGPQAHLPLLLLEESRPSVLVSTGGTELGSHFYQTPTLEYSDEGAMATTSTQSRVLAASVEKPLNEFDTNTSTEKSGFEKLLKEFDNVTRPLVFPLDR